MSSDDRPPEFVPDAAPMTKRTRRLLFFGGWFLLLCLIFLEQWCNYQKHAHDPPPPAPYVPPPDAGRAR